MPGKAIVRFNALKTGIDAQSQLLTGEEPAALEDLTAEYYRHWQPQTPDERFWTDALVRADWQLRRYSRIEAELFERQLTQPYYARAFSLMSETLARLQRRIELAERAHQRARRELEHLQGPRPAPDPLPASSSQVVETEGPSPQIGFVPQPPLSPAARFTIPARTPFSPPESKAFHRKDTEALRT